MERPSKCGCKKGYLRAEGVAAGEEGSCVSAGGASGGADMGTLVLIVCVSVGLAGAMGFGCYKMRLRREMDGEIRSIMSQYMPLENQQQQNGGMMVGRTQFGLDDDDDDQLAGGGVGGGAL